MTDDLGPSRIYRPQSRVEGTDLLRRLAAEGFRPKLTVYDIGDGRKVVDAVGELVTAMEPEFFRPYIDRILGDDRYEDVCFIESPPDWFEKCLTMMVKVRGLDSGEEENVDRSGYLPGYAGGNQSLLKPPGQ